jgi:hypothetical protein
MTEYDRKDHEEMERVSHLESKKLSGKAHANQI